MRLVGVQHHHAHLAACLAEHGEAGPAIGAIFDGTGYGERRHGLGRRAPARRARGLRAGRAAASPCGCRAATRRCASPGGWRARGSPRRSTSAPPLPPGLRGQVTPERAGRRWRSWRGRVSPRRSPRASGRLFDAVAALCGVRAEVNYEGQAAVELEAVARSRSRPCAYPLPVPGRGRRAARARRAPDRARASCGTSASGVPVPRVAARFHNALAARDRDRLRDARRRARAPARSCSRAASSRTARCSPGRPGCLRDGRAARAGPGAAAAERRRDRLRTAGGGRGPHRGGGGNGHVRLDDWIAGAGSGRGARARAPASPCCSASATPPTRITWPPSRP